MSYGLIYTIPFSTLDRVPCVVEIEKEGYAGKVTELTAGSSPFTVDIEDEEFLYTPMRFSTATIRIVGSDYLQSLFSIGYQEYRVTFKRDDVITWCGFIKPELYTQDYSSTTFELELECMSAMSTLEFIDYKQQGEGRDFISLWNLLKLCVSSSLGQYGAVYIPHVYSKNAIEYTAGSNVLESMSIGEQNFFDEDDKPMKLKEVLEEICKFLNWICIDWMGGLYFVDIDYIGEYYKYDSELIQKMQAVTIPILDLQRNGFAGSDHSLDILPGYNKATIKCSNYPAGDLLPDEDFNKLKQLNIVDNESGSRVSRRVFLVANRWDVYLYDGEKVIKNDEVANYGDRARQLEGGILMKSCVYNRQDNHGTWVPDISDYSYTDMIQIRYPEKAHNPISVASNAHYTKVMSVKGASAIYTDCAIAISYSLKSITDTDLGILGNCYATGNMYVGFQVRIGDKYYTKYGRWEKNPQSVLFPDLTSTNNDCSMDYVGVKNKKTLDMPYSGLTGYIIPIDNPLYGELEISILSPEILKKNNLFREDRFGLVLKDLKIECKKKDGLQNDSDNNSDRIYENVVNENYINELDEIEFKISSYNNDGACYSKVMIGDVYLSDNLYSAIEETTVRPEEQLIRRIIKRYSAPRIKLTQVIKATPELTPISRLSDNYMVNKKFINAGGTIDYAMNQFTCIMIEV